MQYYCDWQGSKCRTCKWNADTLRSTLTRVNVHGGDIKTAAQLKMVTQTHALAQAKHICIKST